MINNNRFLQLPQPSSQRHLYRNDINPPKYCLAVRQQPRKARLCSFKDKVDRRPLDPPPIVQLYSSATMSFNDYHNSANFFLHTTLANANDNSDIHCANGNRTTAGSVVQSLHKLKDTNNAEGAFFIFADISIRIEGIFKLKFTLFEIKGMEVERICSVFSDPFQVYSPKSFPGMSESTELTRIFSDQGVRIRIRKEARAVTTPSMKRRRGMDQHQHHHYHEHTFSSTTTDIYSSSSASTTPKEDYSSGSPLTNNTSTSNVMSMQNLLISDPSPSSPSSSNQESSLLFPMRNILPLPQPHHHRPSSPPPFTIDSLVTPHNVESTTRHYYYSSSNPDQPQLPSLLRHSSSGTTTADTYHSYYPYHHKQAENPSSSSPYYENH